MLNHKLTRVALAVPFFTEHFGPVQKVSGSRFLWGVPAVRL